MEKKFYAESLNPTGTMADHCYGRRVYVHRSMLPDLFRDRGQQGEVVRILDDLSVGGGYDKNHSGWLGWELPIDPDSARSRQAAIIEVLDAHGFSQLAERPWKG